MTLGNGVSVTIVMGSVAAKKIAPTTQFYGSANYFADLVNGYAATGGSLSASFRREATVSAR